jgi:hypothetical protein
MNDSTGLGPKIKSYDAARLEGDQQPDLIVQEMPFGDNTLEFIQEDESVGENDPPRYIRIYIDGRNVAQLIEILNHFSNRYKDR